MFNYRSSKQSKIIKRSFLGLFVLFLLFSFILPNVCFAGDPPPAEGVDGGGSAIVQAAITAAIWVVQTIVSAAAELAGKLMITFMEIIVWLSLYNRFIDNPYVRDGWVIMRDLVNMFFILGLLFIAFITVLKLDRNEWSKLLGKLLVMAVLVNFSKSICGLIIDFFQVLMITFVNAYRDITAGNIFASLAMQDWLTLKDGEIDWQQGAAAISALLLVLIISIVSLVVIVIFAIILAFRIVALWALVVFSPLAFFAWVFKGQGGKVGQLANRWWSQFFNYCMIGPFLAFFLWLSVLSMVNITIDGMVPKEQYDVSKADADATIGQAGTMENVIYLMMTLIMLVAGLKFSGDFATVGSGLATRAAGRMENMARNTVERSARGAYRAATFIPRQGAKRTGRAARAYVGGAYEGFKANIADRTAQRMKGKGFVGRTLGAARSAAYLGTEQGAAELREQTAGRARSAFGAPAKKAKEAAQRTAIDNRKNLMDKEVNWENKDEVNSFVDKALEQGDFITAKAALEKKADSKFLEKDDVKKFEKRFAEGKGKQYKGKDDISYIDFTSDLEKRHEKATGRIAAFNEYYVDEGGNAVAREDWNAHEEIMTRHGQKLLQERKDFMDDKSTFDIRGARGEEEQRDRLSNFMAAAKDADNFGNMTKSGRENFKEAAEFLMTSDKGQELLKEFVDEGKIDEQDIKNMEKGYLMSNAEYTSEIGGEVVGGRDKDNLKKFLSKDQKDHLKQIQEERSRTKTGLGHELAEDKVVSGAAEIDTSNMDTIAESMEKVEIDDSRLSRGDLSEEDFAKLEEETDKVAETKENIIEDAKLAKVLDGMSATAENEENVRKAIVRTEEGDEIEQAIRAANPGMAEAAIEKAVEEEVKTRINNSNTTKRYNQFKQGKLNKKAVKDRAMKFVVRYGSVDSKAQKLADSVKSDVYDETMVDIETNIDSADVGDMGRMAAELKTLEEQTKAQYKREADKLDLQIDPQMEVDDKKTKSLITAFDKAKSDDPAKKREALKKLKAHLDEIRKKRASSDVSSSYLRGEWQQQQIRKNLTEAERRNVELINKIKKQMKKMDYDYDDENDIRAAISEVMSA